MLVTEPLKRRLVSDDAPEAGQIRALVVRVAERLQARHTELSDSVNSAIEHAVADLDAPELTEMLHASVEGNVTTILHMLRNDIPIEHVQPATAATEYAVRLARAGVPAGPLRRAYHIGTDDLLAEVFHEIELLDCSSELKLRLLHHLAGWLHRYIDWITRVVLDAHEAERLALLEQNATDVSRLVHRLLDGEPVEPDQFAATTGYRLERPHVATVVWDEGVRQAADQIETLRSLAKRLACALGSKDEPLFMPIDRSTAWVWCHVPKVSSPTGAARVSDVLSVTPSVRAAIGTPVAGVEGFRRTLEQANAVRLVANTSSEPHTRVVCYGDDGMAVVAMLARDLAATRRWVIDTLGLLSLDTEPADRLRETLRTFLRTGSYVETSKTLVLHRNTVKYRLAKAEQERGRPLAEGQLDLELALHLCHVLGQAVLQQPRNAGENGYAG
ncbi:regulator of polyketide synthase expression [Saccharomonospora marina XMU15]|uniref:Regulator of polyketide synthase expression n=1 Tax=Saccharomonospora marina XMU15 TaxID=882083 RepID=H5WYM8_9PSEU|nr:regulator of polyketide synthase expression [Saccharomonospora marina XMU15]